MIATEYQLKAVESLRSGSILCGGVGSGKSFTSLLYFWTKEMDGLHKLPEFKYPSVEKRKSLYIITTAKKRDTREWEKECSEFGIGTFEDSDIPVVIDSWNNITKYRNVKDAFFIFDEQRVVGYGQWSHSFIDISRHNHWLLLSATPGDTWMDYIPVFIANKFYKNKTDFVRQHVIYSRYSRYPKVDKYINERRLEMLRNMILVDMDYVKKTKRHDYWVKAQFNPNLYSRVWKDRWNVFDDEPIESTAELFMTARKVCNADESRLDILEEIRRLHKKLIVFYNFDYELDILREYCAKNGIPNSEWNGHRHQLIPETDEWIYLVQYTAGSEGWNCIETDTIVFYSLNYSYKVLEQSSGRIDRCNTPFIDLFYYHLYSSSNIDQAIRKSVINKKSFNERAFLESKCKTSDLYSQNEETQKKHVS